MKKSTLWVMITFNILAIPLLLFGIVFSILSRFGILLYMFGQIGDVPILMCLSFGITIEGIMLFVLAIMKRRLLLFTPNFILVPVVIYMVVLGMWDYAKTYEKPISSFDETLVIENWQFLVGGGSVVHERTSFITVSAGIVEVVGDDGYQPLENQQYIIYDEYPNGIRITYKGDYEIEYIFKI